MLALQAVEPVPGAPAQVRLRFLGESQEIGGVASPQLFCLIRLLEPLDSVFADRLQHRKARRLVRTLHPDQSALGQRRQSVDDVDVVSANALCGVQRPAPGEHCEPQEQVLLQRLEQVVAPIDRRAHGALSLGCVVRASLEQLQGVFEPFEQSRRRQDAHAGGGELERKR